MNVLIFEDRGSVSYYLIEALKMRDFQVLDAFSIYDAKSYLEEKPIDLIILDMNMSPDGLEPEDINDTEFGLFTGWVWVNKYVFKQLPNLRGRIIIFSEYIKNLQDKYIHNQEALSGFYLIPKSGLANSSSMEELLFTVEQIRRNIEVSHE